MQFNGRREEEEVTGTVGKRNYVQLNFSKIEHYRVVETIKVYKEGDAEITKKRSLRPNGWDRPTDLQNEKYSKRKG